MNASFFVHPPEGYAALLKFTRSASNNYVDMYAFTDRTFEHSLCEFPFDEGTLPEYLLDGNPVVVSWVRLSIADEVRLYYGKYAPEEGPESFRYDTPGQFPVVTTAHSVPNLVLADTESIYAPLCGKSIFIGDDVYNVQQDKTATGSGATCHLYGAGCRCIASYAMCGNASRKDFAITNKYNSSEVLCALLWGPYKPEELPASEAELTAEVMVATQLP